MVVPEDAAAGTAAGEVIRVTLTAVK